MWVPLVMLVVIALASFTVIRLHGVFGRQSASDGGANPADTLVQFNPKHVLYDVWALAGTEVEVDYLDEHAGGGGWSVWITRRCWPGYSTWSRGAGPRARWRPWPPGTPCPRHGR
jgi:hypothetical protein